MHKIKPWVYNLERVKTLLATLPHSAQTFCINGTWRQPKLGARQLGELKKAAAFHNLPWPLPEKDNAQGKKHGFIKRQKGPIHLRGTKERLRKTVDALKKMRPTMLKVREEERLRRYSDPYDLNSLD